MRTVSVIVPTYNCAGRVIHALDSIAAQSYAHECIEIIVIDDGSTDDTAERVEAFARQSPVETRYVVQQNAGPAAARNHGLRLARGDVIAFLDADDWWLPTKLELQIPLLSGAVGLVYSDTAFVDAGGQPIQHYVRRIRVQRGNILLPLFCDFFLLTSAVVLTHAAIAEVGPFDETLAVGEDYEFFLRIAQRFQADCIAEKLLVRCVRPDSLSRRDYALDARIDLETLTRFLRDNPQFAESNRDAVKRRIASYRYDFAYRLLSENRRREAIVELMRSLKASASVNAARTLVRALVRHGADVPG